MLGKIKHNIEFLFGQFDELTVQIDRSRLDKYLNRTDDNSTALLTGNERLYTGHHLGKVYGLRTYSAPRRKLSTQFSWLIL